MRSDADNKFKSTPLADVVIVIKCHQGDDPDVG